MEHNIYSEVQSLQNSFEQLEPTCKKEAKTIKKIISQLDDIRAFTIYRKNNTISPFFKPRNLKV